MIWSGTRTARGARWAFFAAWALAVFSAWSGAMPAAARAAPSNLAAEWHLDGSDLSGQDTTTPDASGNGLDLTLSGPASDGAGRFGSAFSFDGQSSELRRPETAALEPQRITVMAWVKASAPPGPYRYIVAQGGFGDGSTGHCTGSAYALYTGAGGALQFYVATGPSSFALSPSGARVWDGNWHAVAGTYDGSVATLFVDGVEAGSGTPAIGAIDYGQDSREFVVGNYPACSGHGFAGSIDEVRVYDRALSPDELRLLQTDPGDVPPELPDESVPSNQIPPSIAGTPRSGQTLSCDPGTWDGLPGLTYAWQSAPAGVSSSPFPIGTGPSLLVGDLVPGTRIDCAIIAANGAGVAGAASKPVTVAATKPRLGLRIDPGHSVFASDPGPRITPAVGTGGRNVCTPGRWMHWPTRYTFGWYSSPRPVAKAKGRRVRWLSGSRTLVVPRAAAGRYLFCRVVAANGAGATTAFSNVYRVPRATPVARGAVHLMVETPSLTPVLRWDPRTSYSTPLHDNQFRFSCARPTFDRRVGVSYEWQIRNVGTDVPRFDLVFDRSVLKVGVGRVASGAPPPAVLVDDIRIPQMLVGDWTIQCIVAARRHGMEALAFSDLVHVNTDVTR